MTSSIAATTVSGASLRICVCLWGVVAKTDTRGLLATAPAADLARPAFLDVGVER